MAMNIHFNPIPILKGLFLGGGGGRPPPSQSIGLTPRAARITVAAANKLVVERLLPWLKDGISSSESSNPRTSSPDIELGEILKFQEAFQIDPESKQLNETFEFQGAAQIDPEPEQLNKIFEFDEAAQIDPEPEQLNKIFEFEEAAQIDPEPEQLNLLPEVEDESDDVDTDQPPTLNLEIEDDRGRLSIVYQNQGYNARKVNCSCVYSAYILKPVLSGRNL